MGAGNAGQRVRLSARAVAGIVGLAALLAIVREAPNGEALASAIAWLVFIGALFLYGPRAVEQAREIV